MRQFFQKILRKPVILLADKFSSRPKEELVHTSFTELKENIEKQPGKKGLTIPFGSSDKFIIFSDQHKGAKDGSDIFALAEKNYLAALKFYQTEGYTYINLGDGEELWGNSIDQVMRNNVASFKAESLFIQNNSFVKVFGNHDLYWGNSPFAILNLEKIYGAKVKIYEGIILETIVSGKSLQVFLTHGHQGDLQSDGNWFSKWFIANIWGPLELYLRINLNTPSVNDHLKTLHNTFMYEWSAQQKNLLLITGHTHQPVFMSLTELERLYKTYDETDPAKEVIRKELEDKIARRIHKGDSRPDFKAYQPCYFNTGCCCFDDGDMTGIEISENKIRLIKWEFEKEGPSERKVLEEESLEKFVS